MSLKIYVIYGIWTNIKPKNWAHMVFGNLLDNKWTLPSVDTCEKLIHWFEAFYFLFALTIFKWLDNYGRKDVKYLGVCWSSPLQVTKPVSGVIMMLQQSDHDTFPPPHEKLQLGNISTFWRTVQRYYDYDFFSFLARRNSCTFKCFGVSSQKIRLCTDIGQIGEGGDQVQDGNEFI